SCGDADGRGGYVVDTGGCCRPDIETVSLVETVGLLDEGAPDAGRSSGSAGGVDDGDVHAIAASSKPCRERVLHRGRGGESRAASHRRRRRSTGGRRPHGGDRGAAGGQSETDQGKHSLRQRHLASGKHPKGLSSRRTSLI